MGETKTKTVTATPWDVVSVAAVLTVSIISRSSPFHPKRGRNWFGEIVLANYGQLAFSGLPLGRSRQMVEFRAQRIASLTKENVLFRGVVLPNLFWHSLHAWHATSELTAPKCCGMWENLRKLRIWLTLCHSNVIMTNSFKHSSTWGPSRVIGFSVTELPLKISVTTMNCCHGDSIFKTDSLIVVFEFLMISQIHHSLTTTWISRAVLGWSDGSSRGLEHLFCDDGMLAGNGCTEIACQTCQVHHQRPYKVTRRYEWSWSDAVSTLGTSGSHIGNEVTPACPVKSVDEEVCCAGIFIGSLQIAVGHYLRRRSSAIAASGGLPGILSKGAKDVEMKLL